MGLPKLSIALCAILLGCTTGPRQDLNDVDRARIRELAVHPLPEFLSRYYTKSVGPATRVEVKALFNYSYDTQLFRPRAVMSDYCEANSGTLLREGGKQRSWRSTSPESFSDPALAGRAEASLKTQCDGKYMLPVCSAAKASQKGVFGVFQCRAKAGDRLLWSVSLEGTPGELVAGTTQTAEMLITIVPIP